MKCRKPFIKSGQAFGCGQCLPCRIKTRREWSHRILLESCLFKNSIFVTLTYADAPTDGLSLDDYTNFLKRLRNAILPHRLRFYGVGEYGSQRARPHYHFILFGLPPGEVTENLILSTWDRGHIDVKPFIPARAKYIAGYVIDKLTDPNDERLCGLNAEFSTKSLKPGLGAGMLDALAETITRYDLLLPDGDVPVTIRHGGKEWPLGRYLRRMLRMHLNGSLAELRATPTKHVLRRARINAKGNAPKKSAPDKREAEMSLVRATARADKENPSQLYHLLKLSEQEIRNTESKFRMFTKRIKQL